MESHDSSRKTVLITGASKGFGHAIARSLPEAPAGHNVVVVARTEGPLRDLEKEFGGGGDGNKRVAVVVGDVCDEKIAAKAIAIAIENYSRLDSVILNHGTVEPVKRVAETTVQQWRETFETNVFSLLTLLLPALPHLRKTTGSLILVSSGAATSAVTGWGTYGASKAAMNHLAMTLGHEEPQVTTVALRPGMLDTEMQAVIRENAPAMGSDAPKYLDAWKDKKLLDPKVVGGVVARMAVGLCGKRSADAIRGRFVTWNEDALKQFRDE